MSRRPLKAIRETKRKQKVRNKRKTIFILCEGETEVIYFKNFKARSVNVDIRPKQSKYTNPDGIIKEAKKVTTKYGSYFFFVSLTFVTII